MLALWAWLFENMTLAVSHYLCILLIPPNQICQCASRFELIAFSMVSQRRKKAAVPPPSPAPAPSKRAPSRSFRDRNLHPAVLAMLAADLAPGVLPANAVAVMAVAAPAAVAGIAAAGTAPVAVAATGAATSTAQVPLAASQALVVGATRTSARCTAGRAVQQLHAPQHDDLLAGFREALALREAAVMLSRAAPPGVALSLAPPVAHTLAVAGTVGNSPQQQVKVSRCCFRDTCGGYEQSVKFGCALPWHQATDSTQGKSRRFETCAFGRMPQQGSAKTAIVCLTSVLSKDQGEMCKHVGIPPDSCDPGWTSLWSLLALSV